MLVCWKYFSKTLQGLKRYIFLEWQHHNMTELSSTLIRGVKIRPTQCPLFHPHPISNWNIKSISRGVTGIFFWGGKIIFPDFFPGVKCFFSQKKIPTLVDPKQIAFVFKSENQKKKKKKKKKVLISFYNFSHLHFKFSTFPFTIFLLFFSIFTPFPFFPCLFFSRYAAKTSQSEVSEGALCPPAPRLLCHCQ